MSKKRKKRRSFIPESEAKTALKKSFKEFNWRLAGKIFILFVIVFSIFQLCMKLAEIYNSFLIQQITVSVYTAIATVLGALFIIINGGLSTDIPRKDQLKDSLTDKEKEEIIELVKTRREKAKKLLIYLAPFVFTLLLDTLFLLLFVK